MIVTPCAGKVCANAGVAAPRRRATRVKKRRPLTVLFGTTSPPLPLPACGRGIAYGNSRVGSVAWPTRCNRDLARRIDLGPEPANRNRNGPESKREQKILAFEKQYPKMPMARKLFSICDTPAACGERSISSVARNRVRGTLETLRRVDRPPHPDCFAIRPLPASGAR
jgi:hypothetical protein